MNSLYSIVALCMYLIFLGMPAYSQEIIAHRGASHLAPENTLAAVKLAFASGAEAVEVDVHLSQDNRLMVIHDSSTGRTAGGKDLLVKETPSALLRQLEVGSWKNARFQGEKIPYLEEVLALVPAGQKLVIEIKSGPETLPYLQKAISESRVADRLMLISFNKAAIVQAKTLLPQVPAYWLLHNFKDYSLEEAIQIAQQANLSGLDVHHRLVDETFMQQMRKAGMETYVYTVDSPRTARKLAALGVKGITTNRPEWLREKMQAKSK